MRVLARKIRSTHIIFIAVTITPLIYLPIKGLVDYFFLPKVNFLFALIGCYFLSQVLHNGSRQLNIDRDKINGMLLVYYIASIYFIV